MVNSVKFLTANNVAYTYKRPDGNETMVVVVGMRISEGKLLAKVFDFPHLEIFDNVPLTDLVKGGAIPLTDFGREQINRLYASVSSNHSESD
jgi:hypothetical protein